jgi:hypothetical protein
MDAVRKTPGADEYFSVPQAAREIGKANATVLSLVVAGELAGRRVAGRTVITRESVEQYKARATASEVE